MTKKLRTYSNEFKAEAVKKIADNSPNIAYFFMWSVEWIALRDAISDAE